MKTKKVIKKATKTRKTMTLGSDLIDDLREDSKIITCNGRENVSDLVERLLNYCYKNGIVKAILKKITP